MWVSLKKQQQNGNICHETDGFWWVEDAQNKKKNMLRFTDLLIDCNDDDWFGLRGGCEKTLSMSDHPISDQTLHISI